MQNQLITAPKQPRAWTREDGWTPECQRDFLRAIAEGATVAGACRHVGLSVASAYALRNRASGAAFALGWKAANLLSRDVVADLMMARAIEGSTETVTAPDGKTVVRHRHDSRLGMAMLTRLDRLADEDAGGSSGQAARLVAQEFEAYCDMVAEDQGPARAGLFVGLRAVETADPDLAAVAGLARADRYLRARSGLAGEVEIADLDWSQRHGWTAEQWQRADAAGLLAVAAPPAPGAPSAPASDDGNVQHSQQMDPAAEAFAVHRGDINEVSAEPTVFPGDWDDVESPWMTRLPPPPGFEGEQEGEYGEPDYRRALSAQELAIYQDRIDAGLEAMRAAEAARRDAYFGFTPPPLPPPKALSSP